MCIRDRPRSLRGSYRSLAPTMPAMPTWKHGHHRDLSETRHEISHGHRFIMIRTIDSELATNRSGFSDTVQHVCALRAFSCELLLIRLVIPLPAGRDTSQTTLLRPRSEPVLGASTVLHNQADHSKPIAQTVVQRFSPIRF